LFGSKSDKIQDRFWLRVASPQDVESEEWLFTFEAYPKTASEAMNFEKVQVIVDENDHLAKAIRIFFPKGESNSQGRRTVFEFSGREVNWRQQPEKPGVVACDFPDSELPRGWKKIVFRRAE
jgi:hypothetical protein